MWSTLDLSFFKCHDCNQGHSQPPGAAPGDLIPPGPRSFFPYPLTCLPFMYINSAPFSPSSQQTESAFYHQLVVQNPFKKFIYLWLRWVFVAEQAFSSCGKWGLLSICSVWASDCGGFSCGAQALGHVGSAIVAHGLICSTAHEIFPDQGSNPCPLH